jgi:DNA-directed RNA polymerase subunit K/omega
VKIGEQEFDSRFRYVMLVAIRAEQLMKGAQAKIRTKRTRHVGIAMEEVEGGHVKWSDRPLPEEATALE